MARLRIPWRRPRFRYRYTYGQKLFLSHLAVATLILFVFAAAWFAYSRQEVYASKKDELRSLSNAIVRAIQREDDPRPSLLALRAFLMDRGISFYLFDRKGEQTFKDVTTAPPAMRSKEILDSLRLRIGMIKNDETFSIEKGTAVPYMVMPRQFRSKAREDLVLFVAAPVSGIAQYMANIKQSIAYTLGAALLLAMLISMLLSRSMARRIGAIRKATRGLAAGDLSVRSPAKASDELGELARDFNAMAESLEQANRKLELYEKRRKQFIADMTHELRTPLTSIRGIIEGFKTNLITGPEEQSKYYGIIEKETFRLIRLVNELLDTEKVQSGLVKLERGTHNLRELLEIVAETLEHSIERKKLAIRIDCDPELLINGDYDRLMQILLNLVKNAIQFTEYGTIRLTGTGDDAHTVVEVSDTGAGMSPEELEQIWDRFYKADPSRAKDGSETGLGLSIVKQLVHAHGGTIDATSELGIGTTFRIVLPLEPSAAKAGNGEG